MLIIISQKEKAAILDYFNNPRHYISEEVLESLPGGILPDGSKVSREKVTYQDGRPQPRHYVIPAGVVSEAHYIKITSPFLDDPGTHSATMVNGKIYFHQNKDDLPKTLPDNFEDYCDIDEDEDQEDESILAYRAAWARVLRKPAYVLNDGNLGLFKKTIKYAVDIEGHVFYLKSHTSLVEGGVSLTKHTDQYAPQLYMGPPIFRRTDFFHNTQIKRIDITRDSGETLDEFMLNHQDELTSIEIELLAGEILKQYLVQINEKGMVHTDIKAANVCVKITHKKRLQFEVVFIDWDEAFYIGTPCTMGSGTPGYMAPEFFKTPRDYERQLEQRAMGITDYCDTLKSNHKNLFSESSDIYALAIVLLEDLQLETSSSLYSLANAMRHSIPSMRPSGQYINEALVRNADRQFAEIAPLRSEEEHENLPNINVESGCAICCSRICCCPCMMVVKALSYCGFFGSSSVTPGYNAVSQNENALSLSSVTQAKMER